MEFVDVGSASSPAAPLTQPQAVTGGAQNGISNTAKVKIATVMDQSSDIEVALLEHAEMLKLRQRYVTKMGDYPMEREEVTDGQLSAFKRWIDLGHVPAVDFGIWGPHGARTERRLRFTSHVLVGGTWKIMEVPGPDCLETWQQ
eukprot:2504153-Amphidinium_carterae.1